MRARLALLAAGVTVELREVLLRAKPEALVQVSPKATVPVLVLTSGEVLEESRDILTWVARHHPQHPMFCSVTERTLQWVDANDAEFKPWLDRYKYADRYPEQSHSYYRQQGELFLQQLEDRLSDSGGYLTGARPSAIDLAVFPFVRQFAHVDRTWFDVSPYPHLRGWLSDWLASDLFAAAMQKYPPWTAAQNPLRFGSA